MLILASTTDVVQLVTGSNGLIDVHASWMDNVAGAVAPGRTNTAGIATATTTTIVPAPVVNVQRNVKSLHIRNSGTTAQTVGVLIGSGSPMVKLWEQKLEPNGTLQYIDEIGFVRTVAPSAPLVFQKFDTAGNFTWTPTPGMSAAIIECIGGGGSGGDAAWTLGRGTGGGGGSGGYSRRLVYPADVGLNKPVIVGKGGYAANSPNGEGGGFTRVGSAPNILCQANGGSGGGYSLNGNNTPVGGPGGNLTGAVGDITAAGAPGEQGGYVVVPAGSIAPDDPSVIPGGGRGGSSIMGGGAQIPAVGQYGSAAGLAAGKYGSGGSGAVSDFTGGFLGMGPGSDGAVFITEFVLG